MNDKNTSFFKARIMGLTFMAVLFVWFNALPTQYLAHSLNYHPGLGAPLHGQIYNPFDWWRWSWSYYEYAPDLYGQAMILFGVGLAVTIISGALVIGLKSRSSRKHAGTHGTARFATPEDIEKTGLLAGEGVYCGGVDEGGGVRYLRHNGPEHICAIAPTRSGKGVGLVVPTLLSWPGSVFVLDRKGENYAMTAGWRSEQAGNVVLRFDPAEPDVSCAWNPLGEIRFGTRYQISDAQNIALMLVDADGKGIERDHWRQAAFELLTGAIMHALYKAGSVGREPCLYDCAHMLTGVGDFAAKEEENEFDDTDDGGLVELFAEMQAVQFGRSAPEMEAQLFIRGIGRRMANTPPKELNSIISTANNALALYRDPVVGGNTSRSDFRIADLVNHERPVSLYFITTPRNAHRMKPLARLLLTQIVLGLADRMEFDDGRSKTGNRHRLLLMLDEFPTLGKMEVFEDALAYIAGYGLKAYIITQDVQQLYKAYTNFESIISNCHVRIAYAPNKLETAEWLSKMTGQTTVIKEHVSTSGKRFSLGPVSNVSMSYQEVQRPLMTADEVMRLPGPAKDRQGNIMEAGEMLVFVAGFPVIRGRQILYFKDKTFNKRSRMAPPAKSDVVRGVA